MPGTVGGNRIEGPYGNAKPHDNTRLHINAGKTRTKPPHHDVTEHDMKAKTEEPKSYVSTASSPQTQQAEPEGHSQRD